MTKKEKVIEMGLENLLRLVSEDIASGSDAPWKEIEKKVAEKIYKVATGEVNKARCYFDRNDEWNAYYDFTPCGLRQKDGTVVRGIKADTMFRIDGVDDYPFYGIVK